MLNTYKKLASFIMGIVLTSMNLGYAGEHNPIEHMLEENQHITKKRLFPFEQENKSLQKRNKINEFEGIPQFIPKELLSPMEPLSEDLLSYMINNYLDKQTVLILREVSHAWFKHAKLFLQNQTISFKQNLITSQYIQSLVWSNTFKRLNFLSQVMPESFLQDLIPLNVISLNLSLVALANNSQSRLSDISLLQHYVSLQELNLYCLPLQEDVLNTFSYLKSLQTIHLHGNGIQKMDETLGVLAQLPLLKYIRATNCGISDKGVSYLAKKKDIEVLLLRSNKITLQGAKSLCHEENHIKTLELRDNSISCTRENWEIFSVSLIPQLKIWNTHQKSSFKDISQEELILGKNVFESYTIDLH